MGRRWIRDTTRVELVRDVFQLGGDLLDAEAELLDGAGVFTGFGGGDAVGERARSSASREASGKGCFLFVAIGCPALERQVIRSGDMLMSLFKNYD